MQENDEPWDFHRDFAVPIFREIGMAAQFTEDLWDLWVLRCLTS